MTSLQRSWRLITISLVIVIGLLFSYNLLGSGTEAAAPGTTPLINTTNKRLALPLNGQAEATRNNIHSGTERDWLRAGRTWLTYSGQGMSSSALNVCQGGTYYLWVYMHNSQDTNDNHKKKRITDSPYLDKIFRRKSDVAFDGDAIARNTKLKLQLSHTYYSNNKTVRASITGSNVPSANKSLSVTCSDKKFIITPGTPKYITYAGNSSNSFRVSNGSGGYNRYKYDDIASDKWGAFGVSKDLWTSGAKIGYGKQYWPASRYYAVYFKIPITVTLKTPPKCPAANLSINKLSINQGQTATLSWSVTNSPTRITLHNGSYKFYDSNNANQPLVAKGTYVVEGRPNANINNYTLTAYKTDCATVKDRVTMRVIPPIECPIAVLSIDKLSITRGQTATLSWLVDDNPTRITLHDGSSKLYDSNDDSDPPITSGTKTVRAKANNNIHRYTLTAYKTGCAMSRDSVTMRVVEPPIECPVADLRINKLTITRGQTATLSWSVTNNPTRITLHDGSSKLYDSNDDSDPPVTSGTKIVRAKANNNIHRYTLTAYKTGCAAVRNSVTMRVVDPPKCPVVDLQINKLTITRGQTAILSWSVTNNPTRISLYEGSSKLYDSNDDSNSPITSGTKTVRGGATASTRYTLTAYKTGCAAVRNSVTMKTVDPPPECPVADLRINKLTITRGQTATLSWSVTNNPTRITLHDGSSKLYDSNDDSNSPMTSGTKTVRARANINTHRYTLTAYKTSCATVRDSVTMKVEEPCPGDLVKRNGTCVCPDGKERIGNTNDCRIPPPPPPNCPTAKLSINKLTITKDQTATLSWSVTNNPTRVTLHNSDRLLYDTDDASQPLVAEDTYIIEGSLTAGENEYILTAYKSDCDRVRDSITLKVEQPPSVCPEGKVRIDDRCIDPPIACPTNQERLDDGTCVDPCPEGHKRNSENQCEPPNKKKECPDDKVLNPETEECVCPNGLVNLDDVCTIVDTGPGDGTSNTAWFLLLILPVAAIILRWQFAKKMYRSKLK